MATADEDTLGWFVLRARRVRAHSLVSDTDTLRRWADGEISLTQSTDGTTTVEHLLPADEEVFESLAARLRPLTLSSEPIHHERVFQALARLLEAAASATAQHHTRCQALAAEWTAAELQGTQIQGYAVQSVNMDGTGGTPLVSDTQLAAGWMYADLVHADARGPKKEALGFTLRERYIAAVRAFSHLAGLTVLTLELIEHLHGSGVLALDDERWEQDVVVGTARVTEQATVHVAPVGTPMPDLRTTAGEPGDGWTQVTLTRDAGPDPTDRARVELTRADGSTIAGYDATIVRRSRDGDILHWHALVADSIVFAVQGRVDDDQFVPVRVDTTMVDDTNRTLLAWTVFQLRMHDTHTVAFTVEGRPLLRLTPSGIGHDDVDRLRVHVEALADVVALEAVTGERIGPFTRPVTDLDRVRLRPARLLHEGRTVDYVRTLPPVVAPDGTPPLTIMVESCTIDVAGAPVRLPRLRVSHPDLTVLDLGPVTDRGPRARRFAVTVPDGARFLACADPEQDIGPSTEDTRTTGWGLLGIEEGTFPL